jgi:uncharacterized protein YgbK (DUF1537 family)
MIGAIADDFTGGSDVAVALRREGLRTLLFFGTPSSDTVLPEHDALVIALKSRMTPAAEAVADSLKALDWLLAHGTTTTYFKYCSTFDSTPLGNIGPVLDALADRLDVPMVVMTPSSPEHRRTQYEGYLFVGDTLLSESPMRHHPLTPMTDSKLERLLTAQTAKSVGLVRHGVTRQGAESLRTALAAAAAQGTNYLFVDAVDAADLAAIGAAIGDARLVAGAAGLAGGLAAAVSGRSTGTEARADYAALLSEGPAAILAGSCSARTLEQIDAVRRDGHPLYQLDPIADQDPQSLATDALAWYDSVDPTVAPLIYSSVDPERLALIQETLGVQRSSEILEDATGRVARGLVERGVRKLIAAGGETSGAIVTALGIPGGLIGDEAARGVPWIFTTGDHPLAVLLKSGNFGDVDLLVTASATAQPAVMS